MDYPGRETNQLGLEGTCERILSTPAILESRFGGRGTLYETGASSATASGFGSSRGVEEERLDFFDLRFFGGLLPSHTFFPNINLKLHPNQKCATSYAVASARWSKEGHMPLGCVLYNVEFIFTA